MTNQTKKQNKIGSKVALGIVGATLLGSSALSISESLLIDHTSHAASLDSTKFYSPDGQPLVIFHIENPQKPMQDAINNGFAYKGVGKLYRTIDDVKSNFENDNDLKHLRYDATEPIRKSNASGAIVWCIESGVDVNTKDTYTNVQDKEGDQKFKNMGIVAYQGYHKEHGQKSPSTNKEYRDFIYTQRLIQELGEPNTVGKEKIVGISGLGNKWHVEEANGDGSSSWDEETGSYKRNTSLGFDPSKYGLSPNGYYDFKDKMLEEIRYFETNPTFDIKTNRPNNTIRDGDTVTLADKNNVLKSGHYKIVSTPKNVTAKIEGNNLIITAGKGAENGNVTLAYDVPKAYEDIPVLYQGKTGDQNVVNGNIGKAVDVPIKFNATPVADTSVTKTDQHGDSVAGAKFTVKNTVDGTSYESTSDKDGNIILRGKQGDVLEVTETSAPIGYLLDGKTARVTLTSNGRSDYNPFNPKSEYLGTQARNSEDKSQVFSPEKQVKLNDTISYANLDVNEEYEAYGYLMDKDTGEEVLTKDGKRVEASKKFKPKTKDGEFSLEFTIDASDIRGRTLVAFEELSLRGTTVAEHKDINDKEQTVRFTDPTLKTTAFSKEDKGKYVEARTDVVIVDTVEYSDLIQNNTYRLNGKIMDKETGQPLKVDGKEVTATKEFTSKDSKGSIDLEFNVNTTDLQGKDLVVFERLERKHANGAWNFVTNHEDINDKGQTVHVTDPSIHTTAVSTEDSLKYLDAVEDVGITDTVEYENLLPNKTYKMTGQVMDKETEKPLEVDGKPVTESIEFKTDGQTGGAPVNGSVDLDFFFNANDLQDKNLVVYELVERATKEDNYEEVTKHEDINDEGQTVYVTNPKIGTMALVKGVFDEKKTDPNEAVTVTDIVKYEDLLPNKTYQIKGELMNKETGEVLLVEGKTVNGESTFTTPEGTELVNGEMEVEFTLNASELRGMDTVVFEDLFRDKPVVNEKGSGDKENSWVFITDHKDITDEGQTIHINDPRISLDKEISREVFQRGDILTYKFTAHNPGDVVMQNIKFTDPMFEKYELEFDTLEPGETQEFEINYTASKDDIQNGYIYNEATIEGETPDTWEETDKDNVVTVGDKEIRIIETPENCECVYPNIAINIENNNELEGVFTDKGEYIPKEELTEEEIKEVEEVIDEVIKEEKSDEKSEEKSDETPVVETKDNTTPPTTKEQPKQQDKQQVTNLADTGLNKPVNQFALAAGILALGLGGLVLMRNTKRKEQ